MKWWPNGVDDYLNLYVEQLGPWVHYGQINNHMWNGEFTRFKWMMF
jgi:hypothetical protein